jgi:hypothetical protein
MICEKIKGKMKFRRTNYTYKKIKKGEESMPYDLSSI